MVPRFILLLVLTCAVLAHAEDKEEPRPVFGNHPGYLFNVDDEKTKRDVEMVMLDKPKPPPSPPATPVFDDKLSKEIQTQYKYRFGQTSAEQVVNNPGRDADLTYQGNNNNVTVQQYQIYQHQFGDYVIRRTFEYHFDNWFKNDPQLKPIYSMKEQFSNLNMQVKKGYKLKYKYNFAGPSMEVALENPYDIETKLQLMMTGLISAPQEEILSLGYQVTTRVRVQFIRRQVQELFKFVISRQMTKHIGMSLTASTGQLETDATIHEDRALIGFGYSE